MDDFIDCNDVEADGRHRGQDATKKEGARDECTAYSSRTKEAEADRAAAATGDLLAQGARGPRDGVVPVPSTVGARWLDDECIDVWAPYSECRSIHLVVARALRANAGQLVFEGMAGPGFGLSAVREVSPGAHLVAADASLSMVRRARRRVPSAVVLHSSVEDLPLADASVDHAYCTYGLEHVVGLDRKRRVLAELARILRRGCGHRLVLVDDVLAPGASQASHALTMREAHYPGAPASYLTAAAAEPGHTLTRTALLNLVGELFEIEYTEPVAPLGLLILATPRRTA